MIVEIPVKDPDAIWRGVFYGAGLSIMSEKGEELRRKLIDILGDPKHFTLVVDTEAETVIFKKRGS